MELISKAVFVVLVCYLAGLFAQSVAADYSGDILAESDRQELGELLNNLGGVNGN